MPDPPVGEGMTSVTSADGVVAGGVVRVRAPQRTAEPVKVLVQRVSVGPVKRPSVKPAARDE